MVEIKVYSSIVDQRESVWMSMFGMDDMAFTAEKVKDIFSENENEKDFKFSIHCDGGSVAEGLAIYDIIRTSGKNIYTNIEGACHSMAIILLLSAPFENRTANPNCKALIHQVRAASYEYLTADEFRDFADYMDKEQDTILDIYEDRTGYERDALEELMKEEKERSSKDLLNYGFISKINTYSTNKKTNNMSKKTMKPDSLQNRASKWLKKTANKLAVKNYVFTDAEGNELFTTESEDDTLEEGMAASPDGTFELPDGVIVTIEEGEITNIVVPNADEEELETLRNEVADLRNDLNEARELVAELSENVRSTYNVSPRTRVPGKPKNDNQKTSEERKQEIKNKRNEMKGGK